MSKNYSVEFKGTTYRTYDVKADNEEEAKTLAFTDLDSDWEVSPHWKQSAEVVEVEELEEEDEEEDE